MRPNNSVGVTCLAVRRLTVGKWASSSIPYFPLVVRRNLSLNRQQHPLLPYSSTLYRGWTEHAPAYSNLHIFSELFKLHLSTTATPFVRGAL